MNATPSSRRSFLAHAALAAASGMLPACRPRENDAPPLPEPASQGSTDEWDEVRKQFALSPDAIHMSALYIAAHPKPVRDAIEKYRQELDTSPVLHLIQQNRRRMNDVLNAAAAYLGVDAPNDIALTDSTTMGLGLVYNGLRLGVGDDVLTTKHDYYVTHEALRLAALRKGIRVRQVALYDRIGAVSEEQITERLVRAVRRQTRVLALTWVHSGTGLKLPVRRIADAIGDINRNRTKLPPTKVGGFVINGLKVRIRVG